MALAGRWAYRPGGVTSNFSAILAAPELPFDLLPPLEMDGYLTGVLVTPDLPPRTWVSGIWVGRPNFEDQDGLSRALLAVTSRMNRIEAELQKGWPGFHPSFGIAGEKQDHAKIRAWMRGFSKAMRLDPDYWLSLSEDEQTRDLIATFVGFMEADEPFEEREDADELRDECAALIPRVLVSLWRLAKMEEGNDLALQTHRQQKIGRNQPCPCGSGLKFKRCCGGN